MKPHDVALDPLQPGFRPLDADSRDDDAVRRREASHPSEVAATPSQGQVLRLPRVASSA